MQLLEGVCTLGEALLEIVLGGNLLFSQWKAHFYCNEHKESKAFINFGVREDDKTLVAKSQRDVLVQITEVTKFLQECSSNWFEYLDRQRNKYYYLNYYETDQLVILQKSLAAFRKNGKESLSHFAIRMLECLGCMHSSDLLTKAIEEASAELERTLLIGEDAKVSETEDTAIKKKKKKFIDKMLRSGYSLNQAALAMQSVENYDIAQGMFSNKGFRCKTNIQTRYN